MRRFGAAILVLTLAGCSLTPPEEDPVQIKLNDLEARLSRIERSNQNVVTMAQQLEESQGEVRRLRGRIEVLEEIAAEHGDKLTIAKLNIDDNPTTPEKFQIRGIPTLLLFKGGLVVESVVGLAHKDDLKKAIDRHL